MAASSEVVVPYHPFLDSIVVDPFVVVASVWMDQHPSAVVVDFLEVIAIVALVDDHHACP